MRRQIVIGPRGRVPTFWLANLPDQRRIDMERLDYSYRRVPLGQDPAGLTADGSRIRLRPIRIVRLTAVHTDVLDGSPDTIGLPVDIARPLADA